ncbi:MAG TPA: CRISPR-associated helicase Cas3' [Tepidisphaeraceae bacterium]|jgi:CRISPR-associated endonuclease/helicase Cas3|nr:CRISPR-associated helicase Cas3' [Tepidisphaeraceae bacterium]
MTRKSRGMEAGRAWWYAVLRTERDRRLAVKFGRPITARNLRRLLLRRLANLGDKDPACQYEFLKISSVLGAGKGMELNEMNFQQRFEQLTGHPSPRDWQRDLATSITCQDRIIRIPTGLGKTEGVLTTWVFHRVYRNDEAWPRRLIWCLPMRVLVEQTEHVAKELMNRISEQNRPAVHVSMGGEDPGEWFLCPERPAIIIGTQDMLLSRALNRGYASPRARWPMEFGLLNHDALWVMDEVQLMDVGLATSAQLQAFREQDRQKHLRPCHTWWMSATLQDKWLHSVDTAECHKAWIQNPCIVQPNQRSGGLWVISKSVTTTSFAEDDHQGFAERILKEHSKLTDGETGKITLVVCNTVDRACETFEALRELGRAEGLELVHSRFRSEERERWRNEFLSKASCARGVDRIIVATQVVEAGVDISAGCLITELAPWPSLVQRFGRCARYGGSGNVLVVDRGHDEKQSTPYNADELASAWEAIQQLNDIGIASLEKYEESLAQDAREKLYPYSPAHLLLRKEFDELFDTTPDLTGADIDISRFIRSGEERDLQVFWINVEKDKKGVTHRPPEDYRPHRRELCAVPFLKARDWLCGEESKTNRKPRLRGGMRAWIWDWIDGEWVIATREMLVPGRVVCVSSDSGGYRIQLGFDPNSGDPVPPVGVKAPVKGDPDNEQNGEVKGDDWKTIATHTREVAKTLHAISEVLSLPESLRTLLQDAALWHDWGKSHPAFQGCMRDSTAGKRLPNFDLAKAPQAAWSKKHRYVYLPVNGAAETIPCEKRPAFRHELASALGLFAILQMYKPDHPALLGPWAETFGQLNKNVDLKGLPRPASSLIDRLLAYSAEEFDLLLYLVAAHHGKVRVALHAAPADQDYHDTDDRGLPIRGVREGDRLPPISLVPGEPLLPEVTLTLAPASMGLSEVTGISWRERVIRLLKEHGPAKLGYLEAIMVAADRRASRITDPDPLLTLEASR